MAESGVAHWAARHRRSVALLLVALVCGSLVTAQYPYNYVLLCSLLMVCAARGYGWTVERFAPRAAAWRT